MIYSKCYQYNCNIWPQVDSGSRCEVCSALTVRLQKRVEVMRMLSGKKYELLAYFYQYNSYLMLVYHKKIGLITSEKMRICNKLLI